ncbi:DNA-repair protein UVH3, putative [Cryptosporidium muris RN66]|uniref:DNA-repair protein UVH3, putative n=1 Tax=Cryptosporidium muris (strain RN66) TaxID=441375 RepID=B6AEG4_CRYMR|nr:DNA-repair protein UVH3, putative [Cryptosporidium muris RN66]EEA06581.1 DNA-repair protein UVH3, putative [Cryptosporidium muris RN66]|eukprot:XP_002140930.1 DNA-repair protein UVH3 [Cryptosporidium muris RN66]
MGVKGLWDIVAPSGYRVDPESLEGQILAVDASIWLKQFLTGLRDNEGNTPLGAHLLGFFKRLCKLLYYGIYPVVIFDGIPPEIKKRTLEQRRAQKEKTETDFKKTAHKLLLSAIKVQAVKSGKSKLNSNFKSSKSTRLDDLDTISDTEKEKKSTKTKESLNVQYRTNKETDSLFSSSSEDDNENKDYSEEGNLHNQDMVSHIKGLLSERRRLDEIPNFDSNIFAMPHAVATKKLSGLSSSSSSIFLSTDDLKMLEERDNDRIDGKRLMELPLNAEIDPDVFKSLDTKVQYEILIQLRDSWLSASRANAVNARDNMSLFSNVQMECYLRYLKINQEIENVKRRMAKEFNPNEELSIMNEINTLDSTNVANVLPYSNLVQESEVTTAQNNIDLSSIHKFDSDFKYSEKNFTNRLQNHSHSNWIQDHVYMDKRKTKQKKVHFFSNKYEKAEPLKSSIHELEDLLILNQRNYKKSMPKITQSVDEHDCEERIKLLAEDVDSLFELGSTVNCKVLGSNNEISKNDKSDDEWGDTEWESVSSLKIKNETDDKRLLKNKDNTSKVIDEPESKISLEFINSIDTELYSEENEEICQSDSLQIHQGTKEIIVKTLESNKACNNIELEKIQNDKILLETETLPEITTSLEENFEIKNIKVDNVYDSTIPGKIIEALEEKTKDKTKQKLDNELENSQNKDSLSYNPKYTSEELDNFHKLLADDNIISILEEEHDKIMSKFQVQRRYTNAEITKEIQFQVRMLLQAFGIPWIDSPGEAEAQASILTQLGLCDGVLSDDSDCILFGAKCVYRNFFCGTTVEKYVKVDIENFLGIKNHDQMCILALLLGCDYTVGVSGVGPVNALEILKAYPNLSDMEKLKQWSTNLANRYDSDDGINLQTDNIVQQEFKRVHSNYRYQWSFPSDFPSDAVINAIRNPTVDKSMEPFIFGDIEKEKVADIMYRYTTIPKEKVYNILDKVIEKNEAKKTPTSRQTTIDSFIQRKSTSEMNVRNRKVAKIISKRMKKAIETSQ